MKKVLVFVFIQVMLLGLGFTVYADEYDTNKITNESPQGTTNTSSSNEDSNEYKYWAYYKKTGTRYVIRVYDWNSQRYIAVPKEYYINHVKGSGGNEVIYLGVDKSENGKYDAVASGPSVFSDGTYNHVLKWYNNSGVSNFGLTKNDVNFLAGIIRDRANVNGNSKLAKSMQNVIDGVVPYDVRAEILFLLKLPGKTGVQKVATVYGKGSVERYNLVFYTNKEEDRNKWRKDFFTYLEARAVACSFDDDCGFTIKADWLDKIACALYEKDAEYVFANGVYQCSCDWYRIHFGSGVAYWLNDKTLNINQPAKNPEKSDDKWYRYFMPGRCGIPVSVNGGIYYITPGRKYSNLGGVQKKVESKITFTDMSTRALESDYVDVVTDDATRASLYEGWDYITNKMSAISVIAIDKDTGNIIKENSIPYSTFENVGAGYYNKLAWNINGYTFLGNITRNDFVIPYAPIGIADASSNVTVGISQDEVNAGVKKQIIFVYQKVGRDYDKEARISIYNIGSEYNTLIYTGSYGIDKNNKLTIEVYDGEGRTRINEKIELGSDNNYDVNTNYLGQKLGISGNYLGHIIKIHPDYFLTYTGEVLDPSSGNVFNLSQIGNNKVHIIIGYNGPEETSEGNPSLKVSYIDNNGNAIPNMESKVTEERVGVEIVTYAEDLRKDMYMYLGYTYVDSSYDFSDVNLSAGIMDKADNVHTTFGHGSDRRHIVFVYRKIEIKFAIDVFMEPNTLENQLIGQVDGEDYWVLDETGRVVVKVTVTGTEGLNILGYSIKLRIPFDTIMNGNLIKANTVNNLNVYDLSRIIVADKLAVPIWVKEGKYDITAGLEANVDGFGIVSDTKQDDVEVVGRLYDFTVTNIDGSEKTGDEKWKESMFAVEENEYKASALPIGQSTNQPDKYNYGIKIGTTFFYSINTKGISNDAISITPKVLYVSNDGKTIKEVDVYYNDDGKVKNLFDESTKERVMKLKDENVLKSDVLKEVMKAQEMSKVISRYRYSYVTNRSLGRLASPLISKYLSLPYLNYINEFKSMYGSDSLNRFVKTENELLTYATHWYGKYVIPASSKVVDKGTSANSKEYKDGFLVVFFKIISLYDGGGEYLSYNLPTSYTQWQRESLNQLIKLPLTNNYGKSAEVLVDTLKEGFAPVAIYQVGISTLDNVTSVGTH